MEKGRIWILLAKKMDHRISDIEMQELDDLSFLPENQHIQRQLLDEILKKAYLDDDLTLNPIKEKNWVKVERILLENMNTGNIPVNSKKVSLGKMIWTLSWSGAAIVILSLAYHLFLNTDQFLNQKLIKSKVANGEVSRRIALPDSSIVYLNAGSEITYPEHFGKKQRNVDLRGEAYFDVKSNRKVPFVVTTYNIRIKVLGTKFNVKSFKNDKTTETSLIRGKIELSLLNKPGIKYILSPSDKLIINNHPQVDRNLGKTKSEFDIIKAQIHRLDTGLTAIETMWIQDRIVFENEDFETLAKQLERRYNVKIKFLDGENIKNLKFSGSFKNEDIHQVLRALKIAHKFYFKIEDKKIMIYESKTPAYVN